MTLIIATRLRVAFLLSTQNGFGLSFLPEPWRTQLMAGANLEEGSFNDAEVKMQKREIIFQLQFS